jgi:hypothetical protein
MIIFLLAAILYVLVSADARGRRAIEDEGDPYWWNPED